MAFSQKRKEELEKIAATLWNDDETRARLERFMAESGLREQDIAEEIGYSRVAVNHFRHGRYSQGHWSPEQTIGLRAAVKEYIESHPTDHIRRTMGKVYHTETYKEIRKAFFKALDNGFAYCVDGAPGTQ
ncbi:MAG TPA: hypothetical protein VEB19_09260, partial [Gemmatimonadaceae bacterium]|nr:hypothetical protein [Gemmatimonadaceae bacterium]